MMAPSFRDKVILITGAGSGIGRATAIKLSDLGAECALQDINPASLIETQTRCMKASSSSFTPSPAQVDVTSAMQSSMVAEHFTSAFDVSATESVNIFVDEVMAKYGRIDFVFNCAGINPTSLKTEEITDAYWDKIMGVNLKGMFNITRAVIPHLKSGAAFVNVASIAGLGGTAGFAVYCASKYGVIGFSKSVALKLGSRGIRVNVVAPGYIDTPTNASVVAGSESMERSAKGVSMGRMGTPEEVADVVAFLFSDESRYMNGSVVEITGGILKQ